MHFLRPLTATYMTHMSTSTRVEMLTMMTMFTMVLYQPTEQFESLLAMKYCLLIVNRMAICSTTYIIETETKTTYTDMKTFKVSNYGDLLLAYNSKEQT